MATVTGQHLTGATIKCSDR